MGQIRPPKKAIFIFLEENRPAEIKYVEERIIVEVVDRCIRCSDDPAPTEFARKSINVLERITYLLCWDLDLDGVWPNLTINGEQMVVTKQWGIILVGTDRRR